MPELDEYEDLPFPPPDLPVPMAPNPVTNVNPLTTGLQLGILGAAGGMGWAAIHRAIRMRSGNMTPVAVVRPLLVGALIGSTIGTAGGMLYGRKQPYRPPTWEGVEQDIMDRTAPAAQPSAYKFAGLKLIAEKRAMQKQAQNIGGILADASTYYIPGVGALRSGWDTTKSLGNALGSLFRGRFRQAGGHVLGALGNGAMLAVGLIPGGNFLAGTAKGLRAGAAAAKAMRAGKALAPVTHGLGPELAHLAGRVGGAGKLTAGIERAGSKLQSVVPKGLIGWKAQTAAMPLMFGGEYIAGAGGAAPHSMPKDVM